MAADRNQELAPFAARGCANRPLSLARPRERGIALLTAILVVAVGTLIATNLLWLSTLDQKRTASAMASDQGLQYALGAEAWVGDILRQDLEDSPDRDHLGEYWAAEIDPLPIEGGFIEGRIEDLQGRFNLNNLVAPSGEEDAIMVAQLERLLLLLELDPTLAGAVVDWLDPDSAPRFPYGGEDDAYARADPPYLVANAMITSPSELMAINGFDSQAYEQIAPYVTALPRGTLLNVNTATDIVLASLSDEIDPGLAASLVEERGELGFESVQTTFQGLVSEDMLPRLDGITEHFLLSGQVTIGETTVRIRSVLQRHDSGITRTLFRSFGVE
ncbi:MAG TPA: type II secretion system minor pseudopilin GspK [Gammaproteobacteria bacterium]|nr:type II secretion system minor pseudopilin GspK [Gammaproteobacteria bacterium]